MDFTREPIVESIITPKEGCKLVVRSSKGAGQEEYFVDAVEVVSFGHVFFLRSTERPKSFLVPATDYEIIEVRETRMVLKSAGLDRSMKMPVQREAPKVKETPKTVETRVAAGVGVATNNGNTNSSGAVGNVGAGGSGSAGVASGGTSAGSNVADDSKSEPKRRERKRHSRRRRFKDEVAGKESGDEEKTDVEGKVGATDSAKEFVKEPATPVEPRAYIPPPPLLRAILPPPPMLISQGIAMQRKAPLTLDDDEPVVEEETQMGEKSEKPLRRKRRGTSSIKDAGTEVLDGKESADAEVPEKVSDERDSNGLGSENLGSGNMGSVNSDLESLGSQSLGSENLGSERLGFENLGSENVVKD